MRIKKLYIYILKTFFPLLIVSFAISWFVVVMQLLYRFSEDFVGKGLDAIVFLKLMFFSAMYLVPLAMMLAVLVASLMTFGNLGERLELLAMKSAGIPLYRIMKPIFVAVLFIAVGLFIFQNDWMITSQVKFWQYYFSIRNKSPELAIPEGVFYRDMPGFSIYVKKKDAERKVLYNVMIYDTQAGFANASVMVADSARVYSTADNRMIVLRLFDGESFKNLKQQSYSNIQELIPYLRESFKTKEIHIHFDTNIEMMDESILSSQFVGKNMLQLKSYTDSLSGEIDSIQLLNQQEVLRVSDWYKQTQVYSDEESSTKGQFGLNNPTTGDESTAVAPNFKTHVIQRDRPESFKQENLVSFSEVFEDLSKQKKSELYQSVSDVLSARESSLLFNSSAQADMEDLYIKNTIEWHNKLTYPVACIVFFFIGAPLGAIIRKGGIGVPLITAVLFFIFYYVLQTTGLKMVRDAVWTPWSGMWLPIIVTAPIGIWLSWVATKDSAKLNIDTYTNAIKRLLGTSTVRKIEYKEIAMDAPRYNDALLLFDRIEHNAKGLIQLGTLSYWNFFVNDLAYAKRSEIYGEVESVVRCLHDSRDYLLVHKLGKLPFLKDLSRTMRLPWKWANIALMVIFPIGLFVYCIYAIRNKAYLREMEGLVVTSKDIKNRVLELLST